MLDHQTNRPPFVFFLLTFAYAWLLWLPSVLVGLGLDIGIDATIYTGVTVPIGAFAPLAAALTLVVRRHSWKEGWQFIRQAFDFRTKPIYLLLALIVPVIIHAVSHYLAPLFGLEVAETLIPQDLGNPAVGGGHPILFLMLLIGGGQEEFGWRGYAQRPLQERFGVIRASLLIGVIWGLWHLPLWVMPGDRHSTYSFLAFVLMTTSISVVYAWLYHASGHKLVIAMFFHAMNNTVAPLLPFLLWEEGKPETAYWLYAGVNVLAAMVAAYLIQRRADRQ